MKLFDLKNSRVIISPEALLIPEFERLWRRDTSKNKEKALKELSYVYFTCDYKSPYLTSMVRDKVRLVVAKDFMKDTKSRPDPGMEEAIEKYKDLQVTASMRLLAVWYTHLTLPPICSV